MMKIRMIIVVALVSAGLLVSGHAAAQAVDLGTPEATVRSYWRLQEALDSIAVSILSGPAANDPFAQVRRGYEQTVTGRAREVLASPFVRETFSRDVEGVDSAGPGVAHVIVRVRNTTPVPAGTLLNHEQEELRNDGQEFRYILQREGDVWRITQVQRWSDLGTGWEDILTEEMRVPVFARW
jgi:hypothetical protein